MICRAVEVLQLHHVDHLVSGFALAAGFACPGENARGSFHEL